jgi:hypothetical protein
MKYQRPWRLRTVLPPLTLTRSNRAGVDHVFAALILGSILDLLLAVLLVFVSGFIFGDGPEGSNGEPTAVAVWTFGLAVCIATPVAGFVMRARGRTAWGALIVFVPPLIGFGFMTL